jgi:hypothetical protein
MKVKMTTRNDSELEDFDYRNKLTITVDEVKVFDVEDDEPEDSNLSRAFSDCYNVVSLMKQAYEAGKNGEEFIEEN